MSRLRHLDAGHTMKVPVPPGGILRQNPSVRPDQFLRELRAGDPSTAPPFEEVVQLRRCVDDLVGVLALPAIWSGGDGALIGRTLLDVLPEMLDLDVVYLRLDDPAGDRPLELARVSADVNLPGDPATLGRLVERWLGPDPASWSQARRIALAHARLSIVPVRLDLEDGIGVLVVGSGRKKFPAQAEQLVLGVAANQAAIGLKEARLLDDQKRLARGLDERVAQRTDELAEANRELQLRAGLLQSIPVAAWTARPDGTPDFVSRSWLEYTGLSLEEVQSSPEAWMAAVHPEDRERASRCFRDSVRSGTGYTLELRFLRADDATYRWHLNHAVPLKDADGRLLRLVGTSTDIEDLKEAQNQLRSTQAALAHVTRVMTVGELTASIAHEINQPLAGIITNASTCLRMLAADPPNIEGAQETARRTIRDGRRASDVITRLRALFSGEELAMAPVDLNEAAREVMTLCAGEMDKNCVVIQPDLADDLPSVLGDRTQLQQVILNLLLNASEAMSQVDVRPRRLVIRTDLSDGEHVRFTVRDVGVGIQPQTVARLFEPFYTRKPNGVGIGLTVCRSIIDGHGGRIWAEPNDGPGATFCFLLPLGSEGSEVAPSPTALPTPEPTEPRPPMRTS